MLLVVLSAGEQAFRLRVPDLPSLMSLAGPQLKPLHDLTDAQLPFVPRTFKPLRVDEPKTAGPYSAALAGPTAQDPTSVLSARGHAFWGAIYSCKGPTPEAQGIEYKSFNEDGALLRLRPPGAKSEVFGVGVFDQAGGEGQVAERPGAASECAAIAFEGAVEQVEAGRGAREALADAVSRANETVRALGVGAITTFAGAIAVRGPDGLEVHGACIGDSRILHFDKDGRLLEASEQHNLGKAIFLGLVEEVPPPLALRFAAVLTRSVGSDTCEPDFFTWKLSPGDRIVVESDGLGDARELEDMPSGVWHSDRCAEEQGRVLQSFHSPGEIVNALIGYALDQMANGFGKPDNVTVGVIQVC